MNRRIYLFNNLFYCINKHPKNQHPGDAFINDVKYWLMNLSKCLKPILCLVLLGIGFHLVAQKDCDFQMEKDGIKVYTCKRPNSNFNAVQAYFEVEATLEQYASIVLNVEEYKHWNFATTNPKVLKKINENEVIYYTEVSAPWPVTDRFAVLHLKVWEDPESNHLFVLLTNVPETLPSKKGFVRVQEYNSILEITPLVSGKLKVDFYLEVDPGGAVPAWAINLISTKFPINTFSNLKKRLAVIRKNEVIGEKLFK